MKLVKKPWGNFKEFIKNKKCSVKIIEVNPGQRLSLQYHTNREEMWYFLESGFVRIGNKRFSVKEGQIVKIPKKKLHRVIADKKKLRFLEVSLGNFSETDIVRLEDDYGRK
ncbi:MAG TPA: phosphomannose isomerase type II C-terminal cupin domain [Candidatus Nanoarchaeia archaeon]|nr:phosphomannose isomerase type II C-terminal cupin domain [Candidatus Nanoarchaeia archaeon]